MKRKRETDETFLLHFISLWDCDTEQGIIQRALASSSTLLKSAAFNATNFASLSFRLMSFQGVLRDCLQSQLELS